MCWLQAGSAPDVWLQLLEHCAAANPDHQPAAVDILAQLAEKQQQKQQQHAAQQSVAAEQAAEHTIAVAALVDQLQQLLQG